MSKAQWMVAKWAKSLGLTGLAGVVLALLAAAMFFAFILPSGERLKRLESQAAELQIRQKSAQANPAAAPPAESGLSAFYQSLPPEQSATALLDRIYRSASKASLQLAHGEYKFTREKAGHVGGYQVILPVRGSYVQVRRFIAKVLNGVPTAALDGVSFRRETIGGADLEAKIQFTIYLGAA